MLPHLAADVGENLVTVLQLNAEHRIGQGFDHSTLDLYGTVFLCHNFSEILRCLLVVGARRRERRRAALAQLGPDHET
ncbi:hypothetical protein MLIT_30650 [Mycolicibacterium litorale]|uniref:Uncharacterized protein n=1 Tax=Mycolicibacterium litorale TaxID=758802 RepID=A0AAD1MV04_9MYCO|nr:hypothetical protein MLIT_30650 [Mycolicibacterium litorale]